MKYLSLILLSGFILLQIGCSNQANKQTDVEADIATLKAMNDQWNQNALAKNYEANLLTYQANGLRMSAQGILEGHSAIRASMKEFHAQNNLTKCNNVVKDIKISGDLAAVRGYFTGTYTPNSGGAAVDMEGPWIVVYERQADGSWKSAYDVYAELEK